MFAPKLEVPLSATLTLCFLPQRVNKCYSPKYKRYSISVDLPDSPWFLLLILCGDVEVNPGPVCGYQNPSRQSRTNTHLNVHSLLGHLDQVTEFVTTTSPDIMASSETCVDDSRLTIPGFTIHRAVCHRHVGGVCIYVHNSLTCKMVFIGGDFPASAVESIWLEVHSTSVPSKILVGCAYCPPSPSLSSVQSLLDMVDHVLILQGHVIICGDWNVHLLDPNHPHAVLLFDFIKSHDLFQPIASPTRITHSSATLLDVFLVSSQRIVKSSHVVNVGISDHSAISLGLCWSKPKLKSSSYGATQIL